MELFPIAIFKVRDESMEPTLHSGDYVFVNKWHRKLNVGEIIVLRHPLEGIYIVKRIKSIDNNAIYVVGDNLNQSEDSRKFGSVDKSRLLGKVMFKI